MAYIVLINRARIDKILVNNHFEQSYWLSSELYADLIPMEGGVEGFLLITL